MTSSTGRVMVTRGAGSITLTLKHWDLRPTATLTLDEARELVRLISEAVLHAGIEVEETRLSALTVDLVQPNFMALSGSGGPPSRVMGDLFPSTTHGSAALDADAEKLIAMGQDAGPVIEDFSDLI